MLDEIVVHDFVVLVVVGSMYNRIVDLYCLFEYRCQLKNHHDLVLARS